MRDSTSRFRVASALYTAVPMSTIGHTLVTPGGPATPRDRGHKDERALQPLALHAVSAAAAGGRRRQRLAPRGPRRWVPYWFGHPRGTAISYRLEVQVLSATGGLLRFQPLPLALKQ